jgi:phage shock protein E
MNWTTAFITALVIVALLILKRVGQISPREAREHLRKGALVIDARSSDEFNSGHLPNAINLPLGEIDRVLPLRVKDKNQVLLLHCQSGMRSGLAKKKLRRLGYRNAFNLGSLGRASHIVSST